MSAHSLEDVLLEQLAIPTRLITHYASLGIDEKEVMVLIQIHRFLMSGMDFPTPEEIASHLTINSHECSYILRQLIQKGFLAIRHSKNENKQISEQYSLSPLWEKLLSHNQSKEMEESIDEGKIFVLFEQEFGRPLSPFEIETINVWLDEERLTPSLIKAALREAVLMGSLNFKYIDQILRNWKQKGVKSVEDARKISQSYRPYQHPPKKGLQMTKKDKDSLLYYNWLESDD